MKKLKFPVIRNKLFSRLPLRIRNILYYRFLFNTDFPEVVHIENTNACNASCIICPREKMSRQIGVMEFPLFAKIVDECALKTSQLSELHLHGYGECLLENDFCRKISYAKAKGIKTTYIVTNGSLLNEDIAQGLIASGLDRMKVSFYGATEETYEKIHVNLKFKEVENNITGLFRMRDRLKAKRPSIFLQFLPFSENAHEKSLFSEKWSGLIDKKRGDMLLEYTLHNYGRGRNYNFVEAGIKEKKSCVLPFMTMQVLWNGDIVPCCYDFNGDFILGSVRKNTLQEIWNGASFASLRDNHRRLDFRNAQICLRCDQIVNRKASTQ